MKEPRPIFIVALRPLPGVDPIRPISRWYPALGNVARFYDVSGGLLVELSYLKHA